MNLKNPWDLGFVAILVAGGLLLAGGIITGSAVLLVLSMLTMVAALACAKTFAYNAVDWEWSQPDHYSNLPVTKQAKAYSNNPEDVG